MLIADVAKKIFGTQNERELKSIHPLVVRTNELEKTIRPLTNDQLRAKTAEFKERHARGESLDSLLPEAFAVTREAAWRVLGQRHYDVQLIGGTVLHRGRIAEMRTGEGKTLVSTLPAYLNALSGKGVHVVTVNDYLARRDAGWMGQVHQFLGLSVGIIVHGLNDQQRKQNYASDITYGTNNEFGFDYLRDNMKFRLEDYVQREHNFAIIDEVDSILIDEARTPLIISGPSEDSTDLYYEIDKHIRDGGGLQKDVDYTVDEKSKTASLTESGVDKMEKKLKVPNLFDPQHIELLHHVNQALRAHVLYARDVEYVVQEGEVLIVDEFTGRLMPGRRWSDGLHQAIEAKEGVTIESENQTLATITFQNFFRMYSKLSGMTGTADTEATEFRQIYKLDVVVVPTNRPMIRKDESDIIYKNSERKYRAIADHIKVLHEKGQPVLVGTVSVEKSELISNLLKKDGIRHNVLNAKNHAREAEIVAQAGRKGAVTIATNMAGRGTDILLGGNPEALAKAEVGPPDAKWNEKELEDYHQRVKDTEAKWLEKVKGEREEVKAAGGLFVLGTERHESRRIDNQLRGRAGRQGDPGGSRFFLSLEDDLMRIFGGTNIARFMEDDVPIEHRLINKAIENAQRKVEAHNYDIRKHLLEYDDVMNQQRKIIYSWRREVLARPNLRDMVFSMTDEISRAIADDFFPRGKLRKQAGVSGLDMKELNDAVQVSLALPANLHENEISPFNDHGLHGLMMKRAENYYAGKEAQYGPDVVRSLEKMILLTTIDQLWKDHLLAMDHMRDGIGLRGYGQKDPLVEYKKEGFRFFQMMMGQITGDVVRKCFAVQVANAEDEESGPFLPRRAPPKNLQYNVDASGELKSSPLAAIPGTQSPLSGPHGGSQQPPAGGGGSRGGGRPSGGPMDALGGGPFRGPVASPVVSGDPKIGRNDVCPCGSGKKYKKCHGA